jgi:hypothetical protein
VFCRACGKRRSRYDIRVMPNESQSACALRALMNTWTASGNPGPEWKSQSVGGLRLEAGDGVGAVCRPAPGARPTMVSTSSGPRFLPQAYGCFGLNRHKFCSRRFESHTEPCPTRTESPPAPNHCLITWFEAGSISDSGIWNTVAHTCPSPNAISPPLPGTPTVMLAISLALLASTRETVPSPWFSVHTEPTPTVRKRGCGPTSMVSLILGLPVCGKARFAFKGLANHPPGGKPALPKVLSHRLGIFGSYIDNSTWL